MKELEATTVIQKVDTTLWLYDHIIVYAMTEGGAFKTLCCKEEYADKLMQEYERSGTMELPTLGREIQIGKPAMMVKTKVTKTLIELPAHIELPNTKQSE
jgi:hypothetical protein